MIPEESFSSSDIKLSDTGNVMLGVDLKDSEDEKDGEPLPPAPPPLDPAIYEILIQSLDNNNRPPPVQTATRHKLRHTSSDNAERHI